MDTLTNNVYVVEPKTRLIKLGVLLGIVAVFSFSLYQLDLDYSTFTNNLSQAGFIITQFFDLEWSILLRVLDGMILSLGLAVVSLVISVLIAIPISFLAANNLTTDKKLATLIKAGVAILRSVPMLVWGLMVVASLGFGNIGGVVTLMFTLNCFLIRVFTTSIERLGDDVIEALKATGAPWIVIAIKGVLPMAMPSMLAWIAVGFETAVATSISLGMIGIAGIGKVLSDSLSQYRYGEVSVGILVIFITMFTIEMMTVKLKGNLKKEA